MILSPLAYIEDAYPDVARKEILSRMPQETRNLIRSVRDVDWYPRTHTVNIYSAVASYHRDTDGKVADAIYAVGRGVGQRAVESFLRLVMKVMTPPVFARKVPDV